MNTKKYLILFAIIFLLTLPAFAADSLADPSATSKPWVVDVMLRSHIYLPTPRPVQDVFIVLNNSTPNLVYRIELNQSKDPINLAQDVYATTNATPHDPYKITPRPLGPFPKGADLGFTLGDWLAANGTGTYAEEDDNATMNLTFSKLVPNGIYTVWYASIAMPPNYKEVLTPIGAPDGSQNAFRADALGNGVFNLKMKALPPSSNVTYGAYTAMYVTRTAPINTTITWTLISVAYHSDGMTHGATPGEFGKTTHVQIIHLMYPKPARNYLEWKNASAVSLTAQAENATAPAAQKQPGFEGILALTGFFAIAYLLGRRP